MSRPSGLGKGLGALIPADAAAAESPYQHVELAAIRPNPYQPRERFDDETLESLAASVRELGVLQPLLVRRDGGGFELIAGERRLRAAQIAGLDEVPVIVRDADDMTSLESALVENLHRQDLNPLEEAAAFQQLVDDFALTQNQVAKRVGKSRSAVANTLRLLALPTAVQRLVTERKLSAGHARALLSIDDEAEQVRLANQIVREDLSVRQAEDLLRPPADRQKSTASSTGRDVGKTRDPALLELEGLLSDRLGTSVSVSLGAKRGKIVIDYADLDDLERIYRILA